MTFQTRTWQLPSETLLPIVFQAGVRGGAIKISTNVLPSSIQRQIFRNVLHQKDTQNRNPNRFSSIRSNCENRLLDILAVQFFDNQRSKLFRRFLPKVNISNCLEQSRNFCIIESSR